MIETIMVKDISDLESILSHERLYKYQEKAVTITDSTFFPALNFMGVYRTCSETVRDWSRIYK
jgi:hypothetical protein